MAEPRYVLFPGPVVAADGDVHRITSVDLRWLYRVPPSARVLVVHDRRGYRPEPGDVPLHPRRDGHYVPVS